MWCGCCVGGGCCVRVCVVWVWMNTFAAPPAPPPPQAPDPNPRVPSLCLNCGPAHVGVVITVLLNCGERRYNTPTAVTIIARTAAPAYFRYPFTVPFEGRVAAARLDLRRDDGAVCYINGLEVARSNMPAGPLTGKSLATSVVSGSALSSYLGMDVNVSSIVDGRNVLACAVYQVCGWCVDGRKVPVCAVYIWVVCACACE